MDTTLGSEFEFPWPDVGTDGNSLLDTLLRSIDSPILDSTFDQHGHLGALDQPASLTPSWDPSFSQNIIDTSQSLVPYQGNTNEAFSRAQPSAEPIDPHVLSDAYFGGVTEHTKRDASFMDHVDHPQNFYHGSQYSADSHHGALESPMYTPTLGLGSTSLGQDHVPRFLPANFPVVSDTSLGQIDITGTMLDTLASNVPFQGPFGTIDEPAPFNNFWQGQTSAMLDPSILGGHMACDWPASSGLQLGLPQSTGTSMPIGNVTPLPLDWIHEISSTYMTPYQTTQIPAPQEVNNPPWSLVTPMSSFGGEPSAISSTTTPPVNSLKRSAKRAFGPVAPEGRIDKKAVHEQHLDAIPGCQVFSLPGARPKASNSRKGQRQTDSERLTREIGACLLCIFSQKKCERIDEVAPCMRCTHRQSLPRVATEINSYRLSPCVTRISEIAEHLPELKVQRLWRLAKWLVLSGPISYARSENPSRRAVIKTLAIGEDLPVLKSHVLRSCALLDSVASARQLRKLTQGRDVRFVDDIVTNMGIVIAFLCFWGGDYARDAFVFVRPFLEFISRHIWQKDDGVRSPEFRARELIKEHARMRSRELFMKDLRMWARNKWKLGYESTKALTQIETMWETVVEFWNMTSFHDTVQRYDYDD